MKALLLDEIQEQLSYVKLQLKEMEALVAKKRAEVPELERSVRALRDEAALFTELEERRDALQELRKRLAWAHVEEVEAAAARAAAVVAEARDKRIPLVDAKIREQAATAAAAEATREARTAALSEFDAEGMGVAQATVELLAVGEGVGEKGAGAIAAYFAKT